MPVLELPRAQGAVAWDVRETERTCGGSAASLE